jgi:hypothetical protein
MLALTMVALTVRSPCHYSATSCGTLCDRCGGDNNSCGTLGDRCGVDDNSCGTLGDRCGGDNNSIGTGGDRCADGVGGGSDGGDDCGTRGNHCSDGGDGWSTRGKRWSPGVDSRRRDSSSCISTAATAAESATRTTTAPTYDSASWYDQDGGICDPDDDNYCKGSDVSDITNDDPETTPELEHKGAIGGEVVKRVQTHTMTIFIEAEINHQMCRNGFRLHFPKANHTWSVRKIAFCVHMM